MFISILLGDESYIRAKISMPLMRTRGRKDHFAMRFVARAREFLSSSFHEPVRFALGVLDECGKPGEAVDIVRPASCLP
jgi:hypothetical protein